MSSIAPLLSFQTPWRACAEGDSREWAGRWQSRQRAEQQARKWIDNPEADLYVWIESRDGETIEIDDA